MQDQSYTDPAAYRGRMLTAAQELADAGYSIIPLWPAHTGACQCARGTQCPSPGKHPIGKKWTETPKLGAEQITKIWGECPLGAVPGIGIRTGTRSATWVLDVDNHPTPTGTTGYESLEKAVSDSGELWPTRTVRTPTGGMHLYWSTWPDLEIPNRVGVLTSVDVRGDGGMVVAPPTITPAGEYVLTEDDDPMTSPEWLTRLVTEPPPPPPPPPAGTPPAPTDTTTIDTHRGDAYTAAAVDQALTAYTTAPAGTGANTLYATACRAFELANAPWNSYTPADAYRMLTEAAASRHAAARSYSGGQDPVEADATIRRAIAHVGATPAPPPATTQPEPLTPLTRTPPPQPTPPTATTAPPTGAVRPFGTLPAAPNDTTDTDTTPPASEPVVSPSLARLRALALTRSQLADLKPPTPLIEGILDKGTFAVLAGQYGTYKTFVAIEWACHIATGTPWKGHAAAHGRVLYIAAEGASGIHKRVTAWEKNNNRTITDTALTVIPAPVSLSASEDCRAIVDYAAETGAALVVIDTLHRCAGTLDENSANDMARLGQLADALRERTGATVLYVHHAGHTTGRSRGASSIEADADTVWILHLTGPDQDRSGDHPRMLEHRKCKDRELTEPKYLKLAPVPGTESCVTVETDSEGRVAGTTDTTQHTEWLTENDETVSGRNARIILTVIADAFRDHDTFTETEVRRVVTEQHYDEMGGKRAFRINWARGWGKLATKRLIEQTSAGKWALSEPSEDE